MPLWNPSSNTWKQSRITSSDLTSLIACMRWHVEQAGGKQQTPSLQDGFWHCPQKDSLWKLRKYGLKEQFVKCVANLLYHHSKGVVESILCVPVGNKQSTLWFGTGAHIVQHFHQQLRWWHRICPQVNLQILVIMKNGWHEELENFNSKDSWELDQHKHHEDSECGSEQPHVPTQAGKRQGCGGLQVECKLVLQTAKKVDHVLDYIWGRGRGTWEQTKWSYCCPMMALVKLYKENKSWFEAR